jgi:hypothetical protein
MVYGMCAYGKRVRKNLLVFAATDRNFRGCFTLWFRGGTQQFRLQT